MPTSGSGRPSSLSLVAERVGQAQELVAELLGADAADVTLQPSSTHGLMHALYVSPGRSSRARRSSPASA